MTMPLRSQCWERTRAARVVILCPTIASKYKIPKSTPYSVSLPSSPLLHKGVMFQSRPVVSELRCSGSNRCQWKQFVNLCCRPSPVGPQRRPSSTLKQKKRRKFRDAAGDLH